MRWVLVRKLWDLHASPLLKEKYHKRAFELELGQDGLKWVGSKHENRRQQYALPNAPKITLRLKTQTTSPINPKLQKGPQST